MNNVHIKNTIKCVLQIRGHHIAKLDPLGINSADLDNRTPPELLYTHYRFGEYCRTTKRLDSVTFIILNVNYIAVKTRYGVDMEKIYFNY